MHCSDSQVRGIAKLAFPEYQGRSFQVKPFRSMSVDSYWDGGSRNCYALVRIDGKSMRLPSNHPVFESGNDRRIETLPDGYVLVKHSIFCGRDLGITIYIPAGVKMIEESKPALSEDERTVLKYTRSLRSSYAGVSNFRFHQATRETGISQSAWESAKLACIDRGLLNKAGAITNAGRNAL